MSEFQYYEFQALDRQLTQKEMNELRAKSSRAEITPRSFINDYSWGNFKGNEDLWMEKYFDAFLYFANWGTHVLKLRLPSRLLSEELMKPYGGRSGLVRTSGANTIISFVSNVDPGMYDDENYELRLGTFLPIRDELARGDLRPLYLGWLMLVQNDELKSGAVEPPIPDNLNTLTPAQQDLADFLRIDENLLVVAASASRRAENIAESQAQYSAWLAKVSAADKDASLVRAMLGDGAQIGNELLNRYRRDCKQRNPAASEPPPRTADELLASAEQRREAREQEEARQAALEKELREREAAKKRDRHLSSLAGHEPRLWKEAERLAGLKSTDSYRDAVRILTDLRDLAARNSDSQNFAAQAAAFYTSQSRKPNLAKLLREAGFCR